MFKVNRKDAGSNYINAEGEYTVTMAHIEQGMRTPDVMFRLAELYYDESAYARLSAMDVADRRREELRAQAFCDPVGDLRRDAAAHRLRLHAAQHLLDVCRAAGA